MRGPSRLLFAVALLPFAWLVFAAVADKLGANPAEALVRSTGDWTLRMLCIVLLAVTPLRVIANLSASSARAAHARAVRLLLCVPAPAWRMRGLTWGWTSADIAKDIAKRPFILVGFSAFVLLTPLAATSFNRAIRFLGAKRWQALHRLVYAVAALGDTALLLDARRQTQFSPKWRCMPAYLDRAAGLAVPWRSITKGKVAAARVEQA